MISTGRALERAIGRAVKKARQEKGMTRRELADFVGLTHFGIDKIERGFPTTKERLRRINAALGTDIPIPDGWSKRTLNDGIHPDSIREAVKGWQRDTSPFTNFDISMRRNMRNRILVKSGKMGISASELIRRAIEKYLEGMKS